MERRDLLGCHATLCLGKPVDIWKGEIQGSSLLLGRLNEHKAVSTDSTSIAATVMAAAILCLCASLQHLTIMFGFIPKSLLLPGLQLLLISSYPLSCSYISILLCTIYHSLAHLANTLSIGWRESYKCMTISFPCRLKSVVGVLKCSEWNDIY